MVGGAACVFVKKKEAAVGTVPTVAFTSKVPTVPFAVSTGEVASPAASVVAVFTPANDPLAPLDGTTNVTSTPPSGFPFASFTAATNRFENAVLTAVLWPDPLVAVMDAGPWRKSVTVAVDAAKP